MSVHQRKDGRWFVQYREGEKLKREFFGRGLDAEKKAIERNNALNLHEYRTGNDERKLSPTFSELANAYLESRANYMQPSSLSALLYKLESVISPELGHIQVAQITHYRIDQFVAKRLKAGKKKTTIHRDLTDIQAILNWGVKRKFILRNPLIGYEKPKRDDEIIQPPSQDEIKSILKHSPAHLVRAINICYYTGLRPGVSELLGLKWDDVDLTAGTIFIRSAQKNGLKFRVIPLHPSFCLQLESWKKEDVELKCGFIIHYGGKRIDSLKKSYASAKKKAGVTRRLPLYSLRHAFATTLLQNNADLKATSELLGHSRPDTTMRVYQHVRPELHRDAIRHLPDISLGSPVNLPVSVKNNATDTIGHTNVCPEI